MSRAFSHLAIVLAMLSTAARAQDAQKAPNITTTSLPSATAGHAYHATLAANGGKQPYSWSVTGGALPDGLQLSQGGDISGTPSSPGGSAFTVQVTDANKQTDTQTLSINVAASLAVTTSNLPPAMAGSNYSAQLSASGGPPPYKWSISGGSLPQGLSLSGGGLISGTPASPGNANFTVQVDDKANDVATKPLSLTVDPAPLTITTSSLPNGTVGANYSQTLSASGGTGGNKWSVAGGSLPAGLSLSPGGTISGTPTAAGISAFAVQVTDSAGDTAPHAYTITISAPALTVTTGSLPNGSVGANYSQALAASGGTGGNIWTISAGSLPQGLSFSPSGTISGTPSAAGTANFTVEVDDNSGDTAAKALSIAVNAPKLSVTTTSLPNGTVGVNYSQTLAASGGTGGYTWSVASGSLPAGLALSAGGTIAGTPSAAGNSTFTVQVQDSANTTATKSLSITVTAPTLTITTSSLPNGTVGANYSQTLAASGGTGGYTWSVASGSLPAGLALSAGGAIAGTPSAAGNSTFTVQVQDSANTTATKQLSITVTAPTLTITTASLPNGTAGTNYSQTLAASGGTGGYTWSVASGNLPAGLALSAGGAIAGTPTAAGNSTFTVQVQDSANTTATKPLSITIGAPTLSVTTSSLPNGTVGTNYSQALAASGGTGGYTWSVASGSLPAGLALSVAGAISGTPSATGNSTFTVQVQDSANTTATKPLSITIGAPALSVTTFALPNGTVGTNYSQALAATGGTGGYTWSVASGNLPAGLALSAGGTISGTPSAAGNSTFTVQVQDSANTTASRPLSITINAPTLSVTTSSLPNGTVGTNYSQALAATGGTGGYTWSVASGSIPAGLALNAGGMIAGTPSAPGSSNFTLQVKDSSGTTATHPFTIAIAALITIVSPATLPSGAVGAPYSTTLSAAGGVAPYTWSLVSGQLPPALTLTPDGSISGTPTAAGGFAFGVTVTDSSGAKATGQAGIAIRGSVSISTSSTLASGAVGTPYTQTLTATGGTPPYNWTLSTGALPTGLSLASGTGIISGTPTQVGTFQIGVRVADATSATANANFSLTIANGLVITTAPVLPAATVGVTYKLTLGAAGGAAPYQWSITSGSVPAGLNFSAAGQLSGSPTAAGNFAFTAQAVDSSSHTVTKDFTLAVAPALTITSAPNLPPAETGAAYRQALSAAGGTPPYLWSVTAGSLPGGVALDAATGILSGSPTATGTFNFTVTVADSNSVTARQAFGLAVNQGLTITAPTSLPDATVGSAYSFSFSVGGGKQPYSWTIAQGAMPAGLTLDPASGAISGTPTAGGAFTFTVQVTDSSGLSATRATALTVDLPGPGTLQIAGLPAQIASAQQPLIDIVLGQPFPVAITGVLNLSFAPANNAPDDAAVQFSTGGRSATFTIPAGATHATFSAPQFALQTGSVAGTISISVSSLQAAGSSLPLPGNVAVTTQVPPAEPSVRSVTMTPASGGFQVTIVGMSNTREVTQATVTFQPAAGSSLQTGSLVVPLGDAAKAWFQSSTSAPYGGQFSLTIPFSVNGGSNVVGGVSVVLSNSVGDSAAAGTQ